MMDEDDSVPFFDNVSTFECQAYMILTYGIGPVLSERGVAV